ncbi:MAG TPA: NACHT domain-containing protein, partial [Gemmatimonadales bacterium]
VPAVIATTAAVSDPRATELAIRFYAQLAGGERIDLAHERASSAAQSLADDGKTRELLRTAPADGRFSSWKLHIQPGREAVSEWSLRTGLGLSSGATADLARRYRSAVAAELSRIEVPASHRSEEERPQLERMFVAPEFVPVADIGTVGGSLEAPVGSAGSETLDLSKVLGAAPQMVLLGDMGAGKSTLLRYMALRYAAEGPPTGPGLDEDRIPVFIDLAEYASDYEERRVASLLAYLRGRVAALLAADDQTAGDFLTSLMDAGALCLCLDGLDKVGAARERKRVVAEIIALATEPSKSRIVVTSRSPGYNEAPLGAPRFKAFRILPPSKEATIEVLTRWSGKAGAELARTVEERQLELGSFLLATIVALTYRRDGTLPGENDAEYVGRFVTHILDAWDEDPAIEPRERSQPFYGRRAELLGAIGYGMQARQTNDEPGMLFGLRELEQIVARAMADELRSRDEQRRQARRFVELLRYRSGLLVSRTGTGPGSDGAFAFWHPSVQEYLTARHVAARLQESAESGWSLLATHVVDPRWEGVFHLTLGCLREDEAPAELVLERLMAGEAPYERVLHRALFLAARISARAPWLPPEVIQPIIKQLVVLSASDDAAQYAAINHLFWFAHDPEAARAITEDIARWENVGDVLNAVDALDALTVDQAQPLIPRIREIAESPPETLEYGQWLAACRLLARLGRPREARAILRRRIEAGTTDLVEALQLMLEADANRDEVLELLRAAIAQPSQRSSPMDIADLFERLGRREEGIAFLRNLDGGSCGSVEVAEHLEREGLPDDALRILRQALAQPSRAWEAAERLVARDPGA